MPSADRSVEGASVRRPSRAPPSITALVRAQQSEPPPTRHRPDTQPDAVHSRRPVTLSTITPQAVATALRAIRYGKPLSKSPLVDLHSVTLEVRREGMPVRFR